MKPLAVSLTVAAVALLLAFVAGTYTGIVSATLLVLASVGLTGAMLYLGSEEYADGRRDGEGDWGDEE